MLLLSNRSGEACRAGWMKAASPAWRRCHEDEPKTEASRRVSFLRKDGRLLDDRDPQRELFRPAEGRPHVLDMTMLYTQTEEERERARLTSPSSVSLYYDNIDVPYQDGPKNHGVARGQRSVWTQ
jgi:hypothetical protein